ncbi:MAG: cell division protein FtsK [Lachnospiraceae bacterium]|nr:cell division protein FtsK [Lachnospiraceae bacterium]
MEVLSQEEIIALVANINAFADNAESLISNTQAQYTKKKSQLENSQANLVEQLNKNYNSSCTAVRTQSKRTINRAKDILSDIIRLEEKLSAVDKYFVKSKKKREEELAGQTSPEFDDVTDYFSALDQLQKKFSSMSQHYAETVLPGVLNGLNFMLSSQRKKDYDELIILRNTVEVFVKEIEGELPTLTDENLRSLKRDFLKQQNDLIDRNKNEMEAFEQKHLVNLDDVADQIYSMLDKLLPDETIRSLAAVTARYKGSFLKVNTGEKLVDHILFVSFVDYPVDFFVQSGIVASIIKDKCAKLMTGSVIRFPVLFTSKKAPAWLIVSDNSNQTIVEAFTHSVMYAFLSMMPVARLTYSIVDPENRGNSITPFFDAKKKLPALFGEKIYVNRDEVAEKIVKLNEYIGTVIQDRLGNTYNTIFDYEKDNDNYQAKAELLVIYDFPRGFNERMLADLKNILRNGSRCGVYTLIAYLPEEEGTRSNEFDNNMKEISNMTTMIVQSEGSFVLKGLPLSCYDMPDKTDFGRFFSKYMLIYEGIRNRGIAFSPLIRGLVDAKDSLELDASVKRVCELLDICDKTYGKVPDADAVFQQYVTLGNVLYPGDIFSDSVGYRTIVDKFGAGTGEDGETSLVELPLAFDLKNSFNLFLNCPEKNSREMLAFTHHVMWSFLSVMPVTKVNICVFDGEQRGNSIIPFLEFRKRCPDIFDRKIYTSQEMMTARLQKINAQIDEFIQEKLGNRYQDILDYNLNTPNRAELVTLLVIYDFPSRMDGRSIDLLSNILRNGNKCGVFAIICYNPDVSFSRYENIDERLESITRFCTNIEYRDGNYIMLPYNLPIRLHGEMTGVDTDAFINDYLERADAIKKRGLSFKDIMPPRLFSMNSAKSMRIPVGVGDGDAVVNMTLGEGSSHHGMIAGASGSGKSTLLHTIIMSGMLNYSPEQLHLYLMDFKSGTEFKIYESVPLPHIQLLALDAMQEFGKSILENLVSEMEHRGAQFKEAGQTSLKGYIQATGESMPRLLVIMDEFQILFNDSSNRSVAMECAELTNRIVTEGRAFGIHLLMATQSTKVISELALSHGTVEQMRVRVGLKCGENDARYLFSDQNDVRAFEMMKGPIGTAVMNLDYTEQQNIGFRTAYCDPNTQKEYLDLISKTFADVPCNLQTFEGSRTTKLLDYYRSKGFGYTDSLPVSIHMGTLIRVAPPFAISVDKKRKHNLLICGSNEQMANMVANNYMIAALLNQNASVYCIDGEKMIGEDVSEDFYDVLLMSNSRFYVALDRGDIIRYIKDIYQKYVANKKRASNEVIFIVIKNLQFLDIVKTMMKGEPIDESDYLDEEPTFDEPGGFMDADDPFAAINSMFSSGGDRDDNLSVGDKLLKLMSNGSAMGIHFVVSSLEYQTVRETMYYGENILSKFPERVIFSLATSDADSLVENISVAGLRENTVIYSDGIKNTFQLKPYIAPDALELKEYMQNEI